MNPARPRRPGKLLLFAQHLAITVVVSGALLMAALLAYFEWFPPSDADTNDYLSRQFEVEAPAAAEAEAYKLWKHERHRNSGYSTPLHAVSIEDFRRIYRPACLLGRHEKLSEDSRYLAYRDLAYAFILRASGTDSSIEPGALTVRVWGDSLGYQTSGDALPSSDFSADLLARRTSTYADMQPADGCKVP